MSIFTRVLTLIFRFAKFRDRIARDFWDPPRDGAIFNIHRYPSRLEPRVRELHGCRLLTFDPQSSRQQRLILLPGGAYTLEPTPFHGKLAQNLADKSGIPVTLLSYPLAPEHSYQITHQRTLTVYQELVKQYPEAEWILMGDSAGGGLALALLQTLRDSEFHPRPRKTVLISPWVDLTLSNPQILDIAPRDVILSPDSLQYAARTYAGQDGKLTDPLLSPLYGDLSDLGEIQLFCGTREILYPDCQLLADKLSAAPGSEIEFVVGDRFFHDLVIFPLPEARNALQAIFRFLELHG